MRAAEKLAALPPDARAAALAALDEISRPMTRIELQEMLREALPRTIRRPICRVLEGYDIILVERQS